MPKKPKLFPMSKAGTFFDEMMGREESVRLPYAGYSQWINEEDPRELKKKSADAENFFRRTGITFNVYGQAEATERLIPFDIVPRIVPAAEWRMLEAGLRHGQIGFAIALDLVSHMPTKRSVNSRAPKYFTKS